MRIPIYDLARETVGIVTYSLLKLKKLKFMI